MKLLAVLASATAVLGAQSVSDRAFDYVIVGGGNAGLVVAARLSEDPSVTVAVIEGGVHHIDEPLVDTPNFFGRAIGNPAFDWNFVTTPQTALNNAVLPQPRGKMLGGSSGLNFMAWDRASAAEYDAWEELGATGWNWDALLPYFKKVEAVESPPSGDGIFPGATPLSEATFAQFSGRSGVVQPSYEHFYSNITAPYVETVNGLGIFTNSEPYNGNGTGIYNSQNSIDRVKDVGKRSYSASTYYNISASRSNLQATKVIFTNHSGGLLATGVQVKALNSSGISGTLLAKKEVILSAGALQTPQLLELSGIGNKAILSSVGIKTLVDLPGVGENLQDHVSVLSDFQIVDGFTSFDELRNNPTFLAAQEAQYASNNTGLLSEIHSALTFPPLGSIVSADIASTIKQNAATLTNATGLSALTQKQYDIQLKWLEEDKIAQAELIMFPGGGLTALAPTPNDTYITINSAILHPFARGNVHINTSDPTVQPLINPNYVSNQVDLQTHLETLKFARKITESQPLAQFVIGPHDPPADVSSDADFLGYLKQSLATVFHPAGTAVMLPRALGGVVDPTTLKVYGTSNLRVVDASLVPLHIAGHLQATIYAMAEKASDMIKCA